MPQTPVSVRAPVWHFPVSVRSRLVASTTHTTTPGGGMSRTLVLGIGNTLLADEGVGVHSLEALRRQYADFADIEFLDGGTLSFTLAGPVGECDELIVFDAANLNAAPGTVAQVVQAAVARYAS